jgi:PKD repeat protein
MRSILFLVYIFGTLSVVAGPLHSDIPTPWLKFVRNDNQWDQSILYRADIPGGYLFVRKNSLQYAFYDSEAVGAYHHSGKKGSHPSAKIDAWAPQAEGPFIRAHGFTLTFAGASSLVNVEATQPRTEKNNYFIGKDPSRWASNVPAFGEIIYRNLYPGIDLRLFNHHNSLKYELLVAPGADASQIRFQYEGAQKLSVENEQLVIRTSLQTLKETKPYTYQTINGKTQEVASRFSLNGNVLSFQLPKGYQRSYPLVIDPVLVFSTFSGSLDDNWGHCATYDNEDNLYSGGTVWGKQFPFTNGAYQVSYAGNIDVAILKFNPKGTQLLYATFLGGEEAEVPHSMTVNPNGELVVLGTTSSFEFPTSLTAPFRKFSGGDTTIAIGGIKYVHGSDLFVSKFNPQGSQLLGSTYLGGADNDGLKPTELNEIKNYGDQFRSEIITDSQGSIYVASVTVSNNFPLVKPIQPFHPGNLDAVIFRLNATVTTLEWSTYFGGNGLDAAYSLRIGKGGSLYVCGVTNSPDLPTQTGALHRQLIGIEDGFVTKFRQDKLVQVSYLGTTEADQAMLMDLDPEDRVHIFGQTLGNYPVVAANYSNNNGHQFVHAIDSSLSETVFSTVIGTGRNMPDISPTAFLINECGNMYLSGWGGIINDSSSVDGFASLKNTLTTTGLPVTPDAYRGTTNGDDFYIMVLESRAQSLLYGTFFGNPSASRNHVDGGTSRFNKKGVIYQAACACGGSGFPTTPGAWSNTNRSNNCNIAAFKFDIEALKADFDVYSNGVKDVLVGCTPFSTRFVNTSVGGVTYEWDLGGLSTSNEANEVSTTFTQAGEYTIVLKAYNRLTCKKVDVAVKTIRVLKADFRVIGNQKICPGSSAQLFAEGGNRYEWTPTAGLNNPSIANPIASPAATTRYTVKITSENGCTTENEVLVQVEENLPEDFEINVSTECGKQMELNFVNRIKGGSQFVWTLGNGDILRGDEPAPYIYSRSGTYKVTLTFNNGPCLQTFTKEVNIIQMEIPPNIITPNGDGINETFFLAASNIRPLLGVEGFKLEIYNRWGKSVYQSPNYGNDWGPGVAAGLYYYLLTSPFGTICKGWIQVMQ